MKYSNEFKKEALKLSDEIGAKKVASQLGLPYYTPADWEIAQKALPKKSPKKIHIFIKIHT